MLAYSVSVEDFLLGSETSVSLLGLHIVEGSLYVLFCKTLIVFMGLYPYDLITSQRLRLLTPSPWG